MKCIVCDKPISKKARTCSPACKQQAYRNAKRNTSEAVTPKGVTLKPTVTDHELCRYCSELLPPLLKPRQHPGSCYSCAIKQPSRCSLDSRGDTVWKAIA